MKRRVHPGLGCGAFATAQRAIQGDEAMHRLRKGQMERIAQKDVPAQNRVINQMFGVAASRVLAQPLLILQSVLQHNHILTAQGHSASYHAPLRYHTQRIDSGLGHNGLARQHT